MFRHFLSGFQNTDLSQRNIFFKLKGHFETSQNGGNHCVDDADVGFFQNTNLSQRNKFLKMGEMEILILTRVMQVLWDTMYYGTILLLSWNI